MLTAAGVKKIKDKSSGRLPTEDYYMDAECGIALGRPWVAFPSYVPHLRNEWVMVRRLRPAVPRFDGRALLLDGNIEAHARHMSVHFRPWVTDASSTSEAVPHVTNLCNEHGMWNTAWRRWNENIGVTSTRTKQCITNFQVCTCT